MLRSISRATVKEALNLKDNVADPPEISEAKLQTGNRLSNLICVPVSSQVKSVLCTYNILVQYANIRIVLLVCIIGSDIGQFRRVIVVAASYHAEN